MKTRITIDRNKLILKKVEESVESKIETIMQRHSLKEVIQALKKRSLTLTKESKLPRKIKVW